MLRLAVFLGCVVALSSACCTPDQWEGGQASIVGYAGFIRKGLIKEYLSVSYDYTNKRSASTLYYKNGKIKAKYLIVVRNGQQLEGEENGKMYIVNLNSDKCYVKKLSKPFRRACIPDDAKFLGDADLGLKGGLKISSYEIEGRNFMATLSVNKLDKDSCVPIEEIVAKKGRYTTFRDAIFVNITPGIKDPSVFDVPKQCEGVTEQENVEIAEELMTEYTTFV